MLEFYGAWPGVVGRCLKYLGFSSAGAAFYLHREQCVDIKRVVYGFFNQ